jgi:hypothetical protein
MRYQDTQETFADVLLRRCRNADLSSAIRFIPWRKARRYEVAEMLTTLFTTLLNCTVPLQQASMGGLSNPRLAAAVANAGGLGIVSVYGPPSVETARTFDELRRLTKRLCT